MIEYAEEALADFERLFEFTAERDPQRALQNVRMIREAIEILERHPRIGRTVGAGGSLRELVVSGGATGYLVLYEVAPDDSLVRILAIRHQSEAGYRGR